MKVRIKFSKEGPVKFVGHLDTMRYFQKAIRRANLPVAFSGGYSPHMIMSFAQPLGVGVTSDGEYFDIEITEPISYGKSGRVLRSGAGRDSSYFRDHKTSGCSDGRRGTCTQYPSG